MTNEQMIGGIYGTKPILSVGTTVTLVTLNSTAYALEFWEDTIISEFWIANSLKSSELKVIGWEGVTIPNGKLIILGEAVSKIKITSGGRGQLYVVK